MATHRYTLPAGAGCDREHAAARLWAAGALGVWERDGAIVAWFPQRTGAVPDGGRWRREPERDWQTGWREGLEPVRAGRFAIVPSWRAEDYRPRGEEEVIVLDPGRAFGSGHHATTALCLEQLSALPLEGRRVLDVGTGTGILAIAAARVGAAQVVAVDDDPTAVAVAEANIARSGAAGDVRVQLRQAGLELAADLPRFDVVVANLRTDLLVDHAAPLAAAVAGDGALVVSGVAAERRRQAVDAFARRGLGQPAGITTRERWVAIRWHPGGGEADGGPS